MNKIKVIRITKPEQIGSGFYVDFNTKLDWNKKLKEVGFFHLVVGCPHKIPLPHTNPSNDEYINGIRKMPIWVYEYINGIRKMPIWVWSSYIWEGGKGGFEYHSIRDMGIPYGDTFHNTTNQLFKITHGTYEEIKNLTIEQFLKLEEI